MKPVRASRLRRTGFSLEAYEPRPGLATAPDGFPRNEAAPPFYARTEAERGSIPYIS